MYHNCPNVEDIRAMKKRGEKISMLFVTTPEETAAANAARIHMLSIEGRFFDAEMREQRVTASCRWACPMAAGADSRGDRLQPRKTIFAPPSTMPGSEVMPIIAPLPTTSKRYFVTTTCRWWAISA